MHGSAGAPYAPLCSDLDARYGMEVDYDSVERLCEEHSLVFPVEE
jgi:hypothetical protein